ncbi:transcriptional regulator, TetR family [Austwickia chelonae]|uniref:Putative TetR family transcriptional regulator n=1 Tax=Austwickia chelonae NBRC 105200 TaxID=1184607 RepID=K6W988_9MICO|nr:TetR-like C-terminal domain-containing protein [Austwickia chelonae]GAB78407.1 putative TetR family transcriptional regulator [Austwickia chelonae NBRC 105200]SEW39284.1 transcriptional regulator, TetR family [Austwickia chelonae]
MAAQVNDSPTRDRRAQRRQATYDEMMGIARGALQEGRPLSLRAIAADMGMTAPALYRYVDSHAALQEALVNSIYADVIAEMENQVARWPEERASERFFSSIAAFREWALSKPEEFRLVFGQPQSHWDPDAEEESVPRAIQFLLHFARCLKALLDQGKISAPAEQSLPAAAPMMIRSHLGPWLDTQAVPDLPADVWWSALRDWVMLCGVIRMEVDGLVPSEVVADAAIFQEALRCCALRAGADDAATRVGLSEAFGRS